MTDVTAAQDVPNTVDQVIEAAIASDVVLETQVLADSATAAEPAAPKEDAVQARINKITSQKHDERRRAEAAERRVAELEAASSAATSTAAAEETPKLEDFDYDESRYTDALIDHKVMQKTKELIGQHQQAQEVAKQAHKHRQEQASFDTKVADFVVKAPDYHDVIAKIPQLHNDVVGLITSMDNGPELAYYLGQHLDTADELVGMTPARAAMMIGRISSELSPATTAIKTSGAPDPITPVSTGGSMSKDIGDMTMAEIMALPN